MLNGLKLALIGGEEFADGFEDVHAHLVDRIRSHNGHRNGVRAVFLPTCASDDGPETVAYWSELAQKRLNAAGAHTQSLPVVDRASADDPEYARQVAEADWVYIGGGYPHVAMRILAGTRTLQALETARQRGALLSGASAGAMLLCNTSWVITPELDAAFSVLFEKGMGTSDWDLPMPPLLECLGVLPQTMCWPHANQFFSVKWLKKGLLPQGHTLIAIDEQTALFRLDEHEWEVSGRGKVTLVDDLLRSHIFQSGDRLEDIRCIDCFQLED